MSDNNKEYDVIASVMRLSRALRRQPPRPPFGCEGFAPPEGRVMNEGCGFGHGRGRGHGFTRPDMAPPPDGMPPRGPGAAGMPPFGAPSDMPPESMIRLMKALSGNDGVSSRELAELLDIRPSSLTELLAKAEKQGVIVRTADENDKRVSRVSLSDDGKKAIEQIDAPRRSYMEQITSCFTDEEKAEFCRLCGKLADHVEQLSKDCGGDVGDTTRGMPPFAGDPGFGRGHGCGHSRGGRGHGFGHGHGPMGHMPPPPPFGMPPFGEKPYDDGGNGEDSGDGGDNEA